MYEHPALRASLKVFLLCFIDQRSASIPKAYTTSRDCRGTTPHLIVTSSVLHCLKNFKFSTMMSSSLQLGAVIRLPHVLYAVVAI